ncbi:MAG: hypothetical protein MUF00_21440 [Gemmatimonadaceae bacterium]|nr:hypothetical protein [Gemmatimonadaceae bacterium]
MRTIEWAGDLIDAVDDESAPSRAPSPLQQCTQCVCPDTELGAVLLDILGNTAMTLAAAIGTIDGVYVYDQATLALHWVQMKSAVADTGGGAERYRLLAELALREYALAVGAFGWAGRPGDALAERVIGAHPDDPDAQLRVRVFEQSRRILWARYGEPPSDGSLPGT